MAPKEFKYETYRKSTDLIKARLTKLEEAVDKITSEVTPLTPVQLRQLNLYFNEIKKKRADFEGNFNRVLENESEDVTETTLAKDVDEINDLFVRISSVIEVAIGTEPQTPSADSSAHSFPTTISANVRLPKLNLQTFDGSPLQWVSFINLFDTTVHKNVAITNVAKFQYLLSVLSGEPLNLIKSLNLSAPNYLIAYELLRERYHNIRRLSTLHLNHILDLPSISSFPVKHMRAFVNTFYEHTEALKALNCDITGHNPLLSAHLLRKLDSKLLQKLEQYRSSQVDEVEPHSLPTVSQIIKFLNTECSHVEDASLHAATSVSRGSSHSATYSKHKNENSKRVHFSSKDVTMLSTSSATMPVSNTNQACFFCKQTSHKIYTCPAFRDQSPNDRYQSIKDNKRCVSCLGTHNLKECRSKSSCNTCHKKHHTLLHFNNTGSKNSVSLPVSVPSNPTDAVLTCTSQTRPNTDEFTTVLLGTALVKLTTINGSSHVFRALLDSGSMSDFISERAAQLLGTRRLPSNITVVGLSQSSAHTKGLMNLDVESLSGHFIATQRPFHILEKISVDLPRVRLSPEVLNKAKPFMLADPTFHLPGPIDILLGGGLFPKLLTHESHALGPNMPHVLGTLFGFVVMGTAPYSPPSLPVSNLSISLLSTNDSDLHASLQKFWTQEELPSANKQTLEEIKCDEFFNSTHSRDPQGRYVVRLPFKDETIPLGTSKTSAEQRFHSLERKLHNNNNSEFRKLYSDFMQEYHSLGHMEQCKSPDLDSPHYFLPHHGVLKAQSSTTKLRVVFDASCKTSSGHSLNDSLLTGPKLQNNICDILLRFRLQSVVFSCDIRQMYRQIKVHTDDQNYQLILWRDDPTQPLSVFKLTTVTYGMNCSPYLAIKTLQQLAEDEGERFPRAAEVLKHQSYVDDLIAGASTEEDALELQDQLIKLLQLGGFELRKWVSNSPKLLQNLPEKHQETPVFLQPSQEPHFSILGLHWSPLNDTFKYNFNFSCPNPTKRKVLSLIAQIYDPCGFLAPCVMLAKRIMQLLWTSGNTWDDPLTPEVSQKWNLFVSEMKHIVGISIPRAIQLPNSIQCDLHGFCDASENGYAAVVYVRCTSSDCNVRVSQIMAKTRVAPLKRVTLPRLELCGAHLLAQLVNHCLVQMASDINFNSINLWCDSTVTLSWLQTPPYKLKTYVANRVAQTQELVPVQSWRYVKSAHNPADCASRGILPSQLLDHPLWWHGPDWLQLPSTEWPASDFKPVELSSLEDVKQTPLTVLHAASQPKWDFLFQFSSWIKLRHVMAYVLRFVNNCRHRERHTGVLSPPEVKTAQLCIFKLIQKEAFAEDLALLQNNRICSTRLQRLTPFIDTDGIIRVGGRLHHADLPQDISHPVILPKTHHVVNLIIDYFHLKYLHAGVQLTMSLLSQHVWILSARTVVRSRIFKCLTCFRQKPKNTSPLMGDLPKVRITPARAFLSTGIDYGGPFTAKIHNLRSIRYIKAYICIFICLVTKAVHIEVVTDLSTDTFIAALTRFVSRRGLCTDIYSDCGTNFIGANNALRRIVNSVNKDKVQNFAVKNHITFHFNPPAAPHQGGIWESAIKSAKHHLKRVMGTHVLTLSQLMTLTSRVEAMLNSRPLTALSSDPNDAHALTPGHFLIGAPLVAAPEPCLIDTPSNRLTHWQLVQAMSQRIWKRWHKEYLHTLQQRVKWYTPTRNLQVGDLVLIHQDTPPLTWPLARVIKVTAGHDGIVRVVELKTQHGTLTRPAVKVFPLPFLTSQN